MSDTYTTSRQRLDAIVQSESDRLERDGVIIVDPNVIYTIHAKLEIDVKTLVEPTELARLIRRRIDHLRST